MRVAPSPPIRRQGSVEMGSGDGSFAGVKVWEGGERECKMVRKSFSLFAGINFYDSIGHVKSFMN